MNILLKIYVALEGLKKGYIQLKLHSICMTYFSFSYLCTRRPARRWLGLVPLQTPRRAPDQQFSRMISFY